MNENATFKNITSLLLQGGKYTTKELSERFSITQKTVQNYIKKLRNSGLMKDGTKYYFPNKFKNIEIHQKLQMSTALMISLYRCAIPELEESVISNFRVLPKELDAFIFNLSFESIENGFLFNYIVDAIMQKIALEFIYINKKNITSRKNVFPIKVTNMLGYWYLIGYDLEDEKIKTFYIKNIDDCISLGNSYLNEIKIHELNNDASQITSPWYHKEKKVVELNVSGEAFQYFRRKNDNSLHIIKETDTELIIKMVYFNDIEVLNLVKKWLPFVVIINNQILRNKLQNILQSSLKNYQ